ncbi:hypothetical protein, partial [Roseovarius nanhaiticus]|uniref:hypothetical protein n=1 Tax=Roseovarius nanhaiticus TaxID=573024 RepID=UPI002491F53C
FQSHSLSPLLQQMLSKERHQTVTGPKTPIEFKIALRLDNNASSVSDHDMAGEMAFGDQGSVTVAKTIGGQPKAAR